MNNNENMKMFINNLLDWNNDSAEKGLWAGGAEGNDEDWDVTVATGDENSGGAYDECCRVMFAIVDVVTLLFLRYN